MGGVKKVFDKITGNDNKPVAQQIYEKQTKTQSVTEGTYEASEESEDRQRKKKKRQGKRKLQIPSGTAGATTTASSGTGLGTGA